VLVDGFFATGDLGRLDEQGRLKLLGRRKTVIVCAGMKIFPEEVEAIIDSHPQVLASLVYGKDHPQFGQTPAAKVQLKPGMSGDSAAAVLSQLRAHCLARLTSYKTPVIFEAVTRLPRTPSGKLMRG
jgi:long-chain acyl-CoA synthetase